MPYISLYIFFTSKQSYWPLKVYAKPSFLSLFTHVRVYILKRDRQLSVALDWPRRIGNWWVIHSLYDTTYAILRHVQYGVTYWLHTARLGEFTHWESLNMTLWFAWIWSIQLEEKFMICAWINFWFGGIHTIKRWCLNCY